MNDTKKLFLFDKNFSLLVAGCDEAGRGPLAGPVVCAACIMPLKENQTKNIGTSLMIEGINDSKVISEKNRESLYEMIVQATLDYSVSIIDSSIIDEINILQATKKGMSEAINGLKLAPDLVLVDAVSGLNIQIQYKSLIKGDATSYSIAAASIIAKVTRDRIMRKLDIQYPEYGFAQHKGYATKQHIEALRRFGPTPIHRRLFIRNAMAEQLEFVL